MSQSAYNLPPSVANWQPGQPIPQGYRLGRKGFIKPLYTLPSNLSSWQQGQAIPQGFRVGKKGTLKPLTSMYSQHVCCLCNSSVVVLPAMVEIRNKAAVVQEVIKPGLREEIIPVIHREVIAPRVIRETQPIFEKVIEAPVVSYTTLPARFLGNQYSNISGWQQGQPIPQGYYLGKRGFLKPIITLPPHLQSWQQGQPIPQGYRVGRRGTLKPLNTMGMGGYGASPMGLGASPMMMGQQGFSPMSKYGNLPPNVANWQQGQPIPQGWTLGNKGYLKPIWNLPPELQNWQRGQPIPQGYRLGKKGTLKPLNYNYMGGDWNKFQQSNAAYVPTPVQKF